MSDPKRFSYADATAEREPDADEIRQAVNPPRVKVYPEVPAVYPGRPSFCTGCCSWADYLFKKHGDPINFRPKPPIPGEANCAEHKERERVEREEGRR